MKQVFLWLALCVAVFIGGYIVFLLSYEDVGEASSPDPVLSTNQETTQSESRQSRSILPQMPEPEAETQNEEELRDGAIVREWGDFIKAMDIRVNCQAEQVVIRDVPRPEDFVRKCDVATRFDHPYAAFTDDQLEQIAGHDAEAAYLLAHRLLMQPSPGNSIDPNPEQGLTYALNALVQTGEKQVFDLLIDGRHFRNWQVWHTLNGVPNSRQIQEREEEYVWYRAGNNLGFIGDDDNQWKKITDSVRRYESYFDLDELDARAQDISDGILRQRSMVTGEKRQ